MGSVDVAQLKSPVKKLADFFCRSRDKWKAKYVIKRNESIMLANKVRATEKSRQHWKDIARSANEQVKQAKAEIQELREALKKS